MKTNIEEREMVAIESLYEMLGFEKESIQADLNNGYVSINECRNKRDAAWYVDETHNRAIYVDTLEELSEEDIESELC